MITEIVLRGLTPSTMCHIRYKAIHGENIETDWFPAIEFHVI